MSHACLQACIHVDSHQLSPVPSLIYRVHIKNTLFLMDGFQNSRALQLLKSTLEAFTKVGNSLVGDIWIFLDGEDRRNLDQLCLLEAQRWTLLPVSCVVSGQGEGCPAFHVKLPMATRSSPLLGVRRHVSRSWQADWPHHGIVHVCC